MKRSRGPPKGVPKRVSKGPSTSKNKPVIFATAPDCDDRLKVAIDFGATYTVAAVCNPKAQSDYGKPIIHVVSGYPQEPHSETGISLRGVRTVTSYLEQDDTQRDRTHGTGGRYPVNVESTTMAQGLPSGFQWGYPVGQTQRDFIGDLARQCEIQGMKILLDSNERGETREVKANLRESLGKLITRRIIPNEEAVIRHFLVAFFAHLKTVLENDHGLTPLSQVEYIFTIPAIFEARRLEKIMQTSLGLAGLPRAPATGEYKFFTVSEAEAAAQYAVPKSQLQVSIKLLLHCSLLTSTARRGVRDPRPGRPHS